MSYAWDDPELPNGNPWDYFFIVAAIILLVIMLYNANSFVHCS